MRPFLKKQSLFVGGLLSVVALALSLAIISGPKALAADGGGPGNGLRVSPLRYEVTVPAGQSQTLSIFVENLANTPIKAQPIINDFVASTKEDGQPELILDPAKSAPGDSFKTIINSIATTSLNSQERKEVKVTIAVPKAASAGGYYGAVRFIPSGANAPATGSTNVSLTASVGTLFLVTVPGNLTERLSVVSFTPSKNGHNGSLFNSGPITMVTRLQNTGNIHLQPFGSIVVKNTWGKIVYRTEFNGGDPRDNVLPNSIRRFENPLKTHFFGKYTAIGSYSYGTSGKILTVSSTFYVIPYVLIIVIILIILLIVFVLPRLLKAYNKRVIQKARRQ